MTKTTQNNLWKRKINYGWAHTLTIAGEKKSDTVVTDINKVGEEIKKIFK